MRHLKGVGTVQRSVALSASRGPERRNFVLGIGNIGQINQVVKRNATERGISATVLCVEA